MSTLIKKTSELNLDTYFYPKQLPKPNWMN